jgi:TPR repeat protein
MSIERDDSAQSRSTEKSRDWRGIAIAISLSVATGVMWVHMPPWAMVTHSTCADESKSKEVAFVQTDALNNFGVRLERTTGVKYNLQFATDCYRRAVDLGHAEGANNFGFCLEHRRGIGQDIGRAEEYYTRAHEAITPRRSRIIRAACGCRADGTADSDHRR